MADGLFSSKDFEKYELTLITATGQELAMRGVGIELQIFQDIYSSTLSGQLVINDANDIFANFYLSGNDYLKVQIKKGFAEIDRIFRVYKVTERQPKKNSACKYILHFCSEELIISNSLRVSKSYKGQTTSDIVRDILFNIMKVNPDRENIMEDTSVSYDFLVPNMRPFEAIQWAVSRSYDASAKFCYFFYEDLNGFCFQPIQSMFEQDVDRELNLGVKQVDSDPSKNIDSIDKFVVLNDYDYLQSVSTGGISTSMKTVDIFSQSYNKYTYNLIDAEPNTINKNKQIQEMKLVSGNTNATSYDSYFTTYLEINDTSTERENGINKWLLPRIMHLSIINNFRLKIGIPGDLFVNVGTIMRIKMPKFKAADAEGKQYDEMRSCKYLVTAVNHKITEDLFETVVELSSDSWASAMPEAKDMTPLIAGK